MPPQRPCTAEMTGVCLIVPAISAVCDPASRKPPHTRPHRITEILAQHSRNQNCGPRIHPQTAFPRSTPASGGHKALKMHDLNASSERNLCSLHKFSEIVVEILTVTRKGRERRGFSQRCSASSAPLRWNGLDIKPQKAWAQKPLRRACQGTQSNYCLACSVFC